MKSNDLSISIILTLIFMVLKLCKVIDWSWLWVLCPLWISYLILTIAYVIMTIIYRKKFKR